MLEEDGSILWLELFCCTLEESSIEKWSPSWSVKLWISCEIDMGISTFNSS